MKKKVIILGGGIAGMSAAHELIERGFDVEVYEKHKHYVGGKARSVNVPGTNTQQTDKFLPGEHGFRFFPGFYKHITDTMQRTPFRGENPSKKTCFDNLEDTKTIKITRYKLPPIEFPTNFLGSWKDIKMLLQLVKHRKKLFGFLPGESAFFAKRMLTIMGSSYARREAEYEKIGWWDFMDANNKSEAYQKLLVIGVTRTLVAADAHKASTKTDGNIIIQLLYNFINPTIRTDRVLNAPTNDAWLNPWYAYLTEKGVQYTKHTETTSLVMHEGQISHAVIYNHDTKEEINVHGDYYLLAVPADKAAALMSKDIILKDPSLGKIARLVPDMSWMTGIQFYLNKEVNINPGHVNYAYTEWALTSFDQMHFWKNYDLTNRFNGKIKSILSVDVSDWTDPDQEGDIANKDSLQQIADGVWMQLEESLNRENDIVLSKDMIETFYLDHDIVIQKDGNINKEKMLVNTINSWQNRPEAASTIPNLFLASDYVKTYTDLATMEAANEAGRRAVNAILERSASNAPLCKIWKLDEPALLAPIKWLDKWRFKKNPNAPFAVPLWLKICMIPWLLLYSIYFLTKIILFKLLHIQPK
jgi:uncharacterized protein with NAD-binding domain and iron-sulfur cluster